MPIYKNKNGGYLVKINYTDNFGNYKQIVRCNSRTKTKADAKKLEQELLINIKSDYIEDKKITVNELFERFKKDKKRTVKASTINSYDVLYRNYVKDLIGKMCAVNIKKTTAQSFLESLENRNDLSYATKLTTLIFLKSMFNYAKKNDYVNQNFFSQLSLEKNEDYQEEKLSFWTLEQFQQFDAELQAYMLSKKYSRGKYYKASCIRVCFNILFYCGLRKRECVVLQWRDIIKQNDIWYLDIKKTLQQCTGKITTPKSKSSIRKVPVCNALKEILIEHYELANKYDDFNDLFYVCCDDRILDIPLSYYLDRFNETLKLPKIKIHDFRHSYCSMLLNSNVQIFVIAKLLGHADASITEKIYSHIYQETTLAALEKLNELTTKKE